MVVSLQKLSNNSHHYYQDKSMMTKHVISNMPLVTMMDNLSFKRYNLREASYLWWWRLSRWRRSCQGSSSFASFPWWQSARLRPQPRRRQQGARRDRVEHRGRAVGESSLLRDNRRDARSHRDHNHLTSGTQCQRTSGLRVSFNIVMQKARVQRMV